VTRGSCNSHEPFGIVLFAHRSSAQQPTPGPAAVSSAELRTAIGTAPRSRVLWSRCLHPR
jgi:hypothetical protein